MVGRGSQSPPPEFGRSVNTIQTRGQIMPLKLLPAPRIQKAIYTSDRHSKKLVKIVLQTVKFDAPPVQREARA